MNPVVEVSNIIEEHLDNVLSFAYNIPENYQKLKELPICKVETVLNKNISYASNKYHGRKYHVQVMSFIDINKTDIESFTDQLDRALEAHGYRQIYGDDRPHEKLKNVQVLTRQYTISRRKN